MSDDNIVDLHSHDDAKLEALYQQAEQPAPPVRLDDRIKRAAREMHSPKKLNIRPWFAGIAVSVVVGVLFMQLYPTQIAQRSEHFTKPANTAEQLAPGESDTFETELAAPSAGVPVAPQGMAVQAPEVRRLDSSSSMQDRPAAERKQTAAPPARAADSASSNALASEPVNAPRIGYQDAAKAEKQIKKNRLTEELAPVAASTAKEKQNAASMQLAHIIELLEQGNTVAAKKAYQEFKQQHPDYLIAPETTERLEQLL